MTRPDTSTLLKIIAVAAAGQLLAIAGIFYAINKEVWWWFPLPGAAYVGLRYLEEHARETVRNA